MLLGFTTTSAGAGQYCVVQHSVGTKGVLLQVLPLPQGGGFGQSGPVVAVAAGRAPPARAAGGVVRAFGCAWELRSPAAVRSAAARTQRKTAIGLHREADIVRILLRRFHQISTNSRVGRAVPRDVEADLDEVGLRRGTPPDAPHEVASAAWAFRRPLRR